MKKYKTKLYAKALAEVLAKKGRPEGRPGYPEKNIINNFVKLLVSSGCEKKAKEILSLTENFVLAKQGKRKITFETARKITDNQQKLLNNFLEKGDVVKEKINPEIISGVKIIINNERQFDASMQSKLQNIL